MAGNRRGPAPKPTALKVLEGNPGRRALNKREPKPDKAALRCPAGLGHHGKRFWNGVAGRLDRLNILSELDMVALEAAARTYEKYRIADAKLKTAGAMVQENKSGFSSPSPWVTIAANAQRDLLRLMQEFGLTPASRTRIQVDAADGEAPDPLVAWQQKMDEVKARRVAMQKRGGG